MGCDESCRPRPSPERNEINRAPRDVTASARTTTFNHADRAILQDLADIERHLQVAFSICNAVEQALSVQCDEHSADFGLALRWGVADAIALECERLRALVHDLGSASQRADLSSG
jgi:hypothetical protein